MNQPPRPILSLIACVYNEEEVIEKFYEVVSQEIKKLGISYEIVFVNDGSVDNSSKLLNNIQSENSHVRVVHFSKNYGHEAAMIAGIDISKGEALICMDSDLQHPPSKIAEMYTTYKEGYDVITMTRLENKGANKTKNITSKLFYKVLNYITPVKFEPNASDFFLISHKVAEVLRKDFREKVRFLRGFIQVVGFKKTTINYIAEKRAGGVSKYSFMKLLKFSVHAIVSFSEMPLYLGVVSGLAIGTLSVLVGIYTLIMKLIGYVIPGYTTITVLISFISGVQLFVIGIVGIYIKYLFIEMKSRPIYIIDTVVE